MISSIFPRKLHVIEQISTDFGGGGGLWGGGEDEVMCVWGGIGAPLRSACGMNSISTLILIYF